MNWRPFISPSSFVLLALILGLLGWFTQSENVRWAALAVALAIISVGLGMNSIIIGLRADKRTSEMNATLVRIESLQREIQNKQDEQSKPGSSIVPTLQALSQLFLDYVGKHKSGTGE